MLVQVEEELAIIILVPRKLRIDGHFLDASMPQELFLQAVSPISQFVVIVSIHLHPETTGTFPHVVAESLVLQTIDTPASASQLQCLADDIGFQGIGESAMLMFLGEIHLDGSATGTMDGSLELLDFLELREIGFHLLHQYVHLFQSRSVGHGSRNGKHRFSFVPIEIRTGIDLVHKEAQATAQCLIDNRLHLFLISRIVEHFVVP